MILQADYSIPLRDVFVIVGVSYTPLGLVVLWFARMSLKTFSRVDSIAQALWGSPEGKGEDGLISLVHQQVGAMGLIANEHIAMQQSMDNIKRRCDATHPRTP